MPLVRALTEARFVVASMPICRDRGSGCNLPVNEELARPGVIVFGVSEANAAVFISSPPGELIVRVALAA